MARRSFATVGALGVLGSGDSVRDERCQLIDPPKVMVVMMENEGASQIIGNSALPYVTSLAANYGSATQSYAFGHPSLPDYLDLVSGSNEGVTDDNPPSSHSFPGGADPGRSTRDRRATAWPPTPRTCRQIPRNDSGLYAVRHNPWAVLPERAGHGERRLVAHLRPERFRCRPTSCGTRRTSPMTATPASPATPRRMSWPTPRTSCRVSSRRCRRPSLVQVGRPDHHRVGRGPPERHVGSQRGERWACRDDRVSKYLAAQPAAGLHARVDRGNPRARSSTSTCCPISVQASDGQTETSIRCCPGRCTRPGPHRLLHGCAV